LNVAVVQTHQTLTAFRAAVAPGLAAADREFLARLDESPEFSFEVDRLPQAFPAPGLILAGRQDSMCGYSEAWDLLENFPRATFAVLERAGHGLAQEQKGLFRALVGEWLDRVDEYATGAAAQR
jgi:pimeloyl-ACP methyl ester carboxylesterase